MASLQNLYLLSLSPALILTVVEGLCCVLPQTPGQEILLLIIHQHPWSLVLGPLAPPQQLQGSAFGTDAHRPRGAC